MSRQTLCRECQWTYHRDYQREQYAPIKAENKNKKKIDDQFKRLYALTKVKEKQLKLNFDSDTEKLKHKARNILRGVK